MVRPRRRAIDGRAALELKPRIIRGPREAHLGRVGPGDVQARQCGRECQVIAIATDVADAKRHSIQGDDFPFGSERCICDETRDRTWRCFVDDGENLAWLRITTRRW